MPRAAHVSVESLRGEPLDATSRNQAPEASPERADKGVTGLSRAAGSLDSGMEPGMFLEDLASSASHASRS